MPSSLADRISRHPRAVTAALTALALTFAAGSFFVGPTDLSPWALLRGLGNAHDLAGIVAREIRLPRALLGLTVGAALGASGAALQGLFRNPLAEPGVTGVTASAGLGAVIALYFGLALLHPLMLPALAVTGALISAVVLFLLARAGAGTVALILAGVAVSSFAAALTALALTLSPNPYALSEMLLWLMGSLKDRSWSDLAYALPLTVAGIALFLQCGRGLDGLTLGEDTAVSLGIDTTKLRRRIVIAVALATGGATAAAGAVSFVGLVVPHLLRPFCGYRPSRLILPSTLGGAALVCAADLGLRLAMPDGKLLLGVVTALIGAPFFFGLIVRLRGQP